MVTDDLFFGDMNRLDDEIYKIVGIWIYRLIKLL